MKAKQYYVTYSRKSSRPGDRQAQSLPDQMSDVKKVSVRGNYPIVQDFVESHSAFHPRARDVFNSMLEYVEKRSDIKGIIFRDVDRSNRNLIDAGTLWDLIDRGVIEELITPTETYDINHFPMFGIQSVLASEYSRTISKKVKGSIQSRIARGIAPFIPPPGYVSDPAALKGQKTHIPHPVYFPIVRKVFELFMTGDYSIVRLATAANDLGLRNTRGRKISKTQLFNMLKNSFYKGKFVINGKEYDGIHKPMLTESEYQLIQEIMTGRSHPRLQHREYPLNGFVRCGECGRAICGETHSKTYKNGKQGVFIHYRCSGASKTPKCSQKANIPPKELEDQILNYLATLELDKEWIEFGIKWALEMELEDQGRSESVRDALQNAHQTVTRRINNLVKTKAELGDSFDAQEFNNQLHEMTSEKKATEKKLAELEQNFDDSLEWTRRTVNFAEETFRKFSTGTLQDKRVVIEAVGSNLILKDRKLTIQPIKPFRVLQDAKNLASKQAAKLEPGKSVAISDISSHLHTPHSIMRGLRDDIRTYWGDGKVNSEKEILRSILMADDNLISKTQGYAF